MIRAPLNLSPGAYVFKCIQLNFENNKCSLTENQHRLDLIIL